MPKAPSTIADSIQKAYSDCLQSNGARVEIVLPKNGHRVKAYGVGQNLLRIDVQFAWQRNFSEAPDGEIGPVIGDDGKILFR